MNLFDIMRSAGGGDAFSALAAQYGLSEAQVAKAVEAFMPAFSAGLKRSTADPLGLADFMRRLALGDYSRAWRQPDWAFGSGRREGDEALGFLFGSPEAARAFAKQAAAFTGLAQEKLAELMPALAAMMFGGLAQQATSANPMLDAMLKQFRAHADSAAPTEKGPLDRYEEEQTRKEAAPPGAAELARMQQEMMQAGMAALQGGAAAWQQALGGMKVPGGATADNASRPEGKVSGRDVFGEMFEPGLRLSEAYRREIEGLMERLRPDTTRK